MYMFLNPEQEAMLPVPKTIEDAESQVHANIEAIMSWRSSAQKGSRNACITCGFYLGRIAALYREFPSLAKTTRKEAMGLNRVLNDIVDGVGVAPDTDTESKESRQ